MRSISIFNSNKSSEKNKCTLFGVFLFFVLLFPFLGHAQYKNYDISNLSGAIKVSEPPNVTYPAQRVLSVNTVIARIAPVFQGNLVSIESASISPALPAGLSISSAGIISGTTSVIIPNTKFTITLSNTCGTSTRDIYIRTVVGPNITKQPFCVDTICTTSYTQLIEVEAVNSNTISNLTYQWRKDGVPLTDGFQNGSIISGAKSSRLSIITPTSFFANARYDVVVSNNEVSIESADTSFKMITPPQIITQPSVPAPICELNGMAILSVSASGVNTLNYRWRKDGLPIADGGVYTGVSSSSLQIKNPALTDSGYYDVDIDNGYCAITSVVIPVKLNFARILGDQTKRDTIFCEGQEESKTLQLSTIGTNLRYQWLVFSPPYSTYMGQVRGTEFSGLSTSSLTISNPASRHGGIYTLSAYSGNCPIAAKGEINLVILKNPVIHSELRAENSVNFASGIRLAVGATGEDVEFVWRKNGVPIADAVLNNTSLFRKRAENYAPQPGSWDRVWYASLDIKQASYDITEGTYDVIVKNKGCLPATSIPYVLQFNRVPSNITQQPVSPAEYNCPSSDVVLNVNATGSNLSYQWRRNGVPIPLSSTFTVSNNGTTLTINKVYSLQSFYYQYIDRQGVYDVVVTGTDGTVVSNSVNVRYYNTPELLTPNYKDFIFCKKDSNTLIIKAKRTLADSLNFIWYDAGLNNRVITTYSGENVEFATLINNNITPTSYTYKITNRCGLIQTRNVNIVFNNESADSIAARIIVPSVVCNKAGNVVLTTASNQSNWLKYYQWQKDGVDLPQNSKYVQSLSGRSLTINNPTFADTGFYELIIRYDELRGGCKISSGKTFLKIDSNSRIISAPVTAPVIFSGNGVQTLNVVAQGSNLNYQWYKGNLVSNNTVISGQGTSTLTFTNNTIPNSGFYDLLVTGKCLLVDSIATPSVWYSNIYVPVLSNLEIITNPTSFGAVCAGNSDVNLRVRSSANITARGGSLSYYWRKDGVVINDQDFGGGHQISGTRSSQIIIDKPNQSDTGTYDIVAVQSYYDSNYNRTISESVVTAGTKLIVNAPTTSITYAQINVNTYYRWSKNNVPYNQAGTYYNTTNCNLDTLVLTVIPNSSTDTTVTICQGETFRWRVSQIEYAQTGDYRFTLNNVNYLLRLMVRSRPNVSISGSANVCAGASTTINITQTNAGIGIASGVLSDGTTFNGFGQSRISIPVSPSSTTTYTISSLTDGVCAALPVNISGSAVVNVSTPPTATMSSPAWNCGALIDSPATIRLSFGGTGPWSGYLSNGNWPQNIYFNSIANIIDVPVSYPGNVLGFTGRTVTIGSLWNQQGCYAQSSMLNGSLFIPAKSAITYVNPTQATSQFRSDAYKSQKICRNTSIQSIAYSVSNGDSLMVTGLPTGLTANFRRVYTFNNASNQTVTVNKALVITGTPTVIGTFRYYVSVPANFGCGIVRDSGVITVLGDNTLTLSTALGSNNQTVLQSAPIDSIKYTTSNTTGATVTGLPYGVNATWSNNQLVISGVSNYLGNYNYTVTLNDACGTNSVKTGTINVVNQYSNSLNLFEGANSGYACKDLPISSLRFASSLPTLNDSHTSVTGLPSGLTATWTADTLTISGTPTQTGVFNYQIAYTAGRVFQGVINVLKRETLSLFSGASTQTLCNQTYLENIAFQNSMGIYAPINQVGLPNGVLQTYDQGKYNIYGSPNQPGVYPYKLYLSSACGIDSIGGVITMLEPSTPITLTSAVNTDQQKLCLNSAITNITYQSANAVDAFISGLPQGLTTTWVNNVFTISGTPTEFGTFNYRLSMYNSGNCSRVDITGRITVLPNIAVSTTLTDTLYALQNNINSLYLNFGDLNSPYQLTNTFAPIAMGLPAGLNASASNSIQTGFRDGVMLSGSPNATGYYNFTVTSNNFCGAPSVSGVIRVVANNTYQLMSSNATTSQNVCKNSAITPVVYNCYFLGAPGIITITGLPTGVSVRGAYMTTAELDGERSTNYLGVYNRVYKTRYQIVRYTQNPITQLIIEGTPTEGGVFNYTIEDNRGSAIITNSITVGTSELTLASGSQYPASMRPLYINETPVNVYNIGDSSQVKYLGNPIDPIVFGRGEGTLNISVSGLPPGLTAAMSTHTYQTDGLPKKSYEITGTPTASGTFHYTITVSGSCGTKNYTGTIVVKSNPTIALASATSTLTQEICRNAAITPVQFNLGNRGNNAIVSGLPIGVTGSFANGIFTLSGNPQQAGTYNYVIKPVDTSWSILDTLLPNVKVALALRKLVKNYNGPAIRLKRPDGVSRDFGFVGTELDTAAINTWAKAMDPDILIGVQMPWRLFCTKLYDQSGNGADYIAPEPTTTESVWNWAAPVFNSDYLYTNIEGVTAILPRLSFAFMGSLLNDRVYSAPYTTAVGVQKPNERSSHSTFFTEASAASGLSVQASLNMGSGLLNNAMVQLPYSLFTGLLVFNKVLSADDREDVNNLLDAYYSTYSTFAPGTYPFKATGTITVRTLPEITVESSSTKNCINDQVTLTASGAQSYLWDNNTTGNVNLVNPQRNTIYTVTGTDAYGCSNLGSINVQTTSLINNRDTAICENKSLVLTASSTDYASPEVRYIQIWATYSDSTEQIEDMYSYPPNMPKNAGRMIVGEIQAYKNGVNIARNLPSMSAYSPFSDYSDPQAYIAGDKTFDGDDNTAWVSGLTDFMGNSLGQICCQDGYTPFYFEMDLGAPIALDSIRIFTSNKYNQSFKVFAMLDRYDQFSNYYQLGEEVMAKGSFVYNFASNAAPVSYQWNTGETTPQITVNPTQTTTYSCTITGTKTCYDEVVVTVNNCQPVYHTFQVNACESYTLPWGDVVTTTGSYVNTYNNAVGADSVVTANVVINQPVTVNISASGIDTYLWNGITYRSSGMKYWRGSTVNGCDSIVILNLTLATTCQTTYAIDTVYACNSYQWHGVTYTASNNTATWRTDNVAGCDSIVQLNLIITKVIPSSPASITQTLVSNDCGQRVYRYVAAVSANAMGYVWTLPASVGGVAGVTVDSGDISRSSVIKVKYASNAASIAGDSIKVRAWSSCGNSAARSAKLINTLLVVPTAPATITITAVTINVCGNKVYRYIGPSLPTNATGYVWSFTGVLGANAVIDSGNVNSQRILVRYTSNVASATGDSVKLLYTTICGLSPVKAVKLTNTLLTAPAAPAGITITSIVTNNCAIKRYRYSAPALVAATTTSLAATGYVWSFTGVLGAVIDSGSSGSQVITVTFGSNAAANAGDSVKLCYTSNCGNSPFKAAKLTNTLTTAPAAPASIAITPIVTNVCGSKRYRYSAPALVAATTTSLAATGYVWSFTGVLGAVIDSGSSGSQVITVTFSNNAASVTGDSVRVAYTSSCGNSLNKSAKLTNTLLAPPAAPATITITPVVTNVCGARKYRYAASGLTLASTTAVAATGWLWSLPEGPIGSTGTIDSGTINSQTIVVVYTSNGAAVSGDTIRVRYTSNCGLSITKATKLTNTLLSPPSVPASIIITTISDVCGARRYRYTAPVLPVATTTATAATGYAWGFVGSLASNAYANIDSGSLSSRIFTVTFTNNQAALTGDSIYLSYTSACGNSLNKTAKLTNTLLAAPSAPASLTQTLIDNSCGARIYRYTAASVTNAIGYSWTLPVSVGAVAGVIVDSGDITSSRVIRLKYASNALALATDSIKVSAYNNCVSSSVKGFKLTNAAWVALAAPVMTKTNVVTNECGARKVRYSIAVPSTTSGSVAAEWSFVGPVHGANAVIDSGSISSRVIVVKYSNNAASSTLDSVRVRYNYNNGCSYGAYVRTSVGLTALTIPAAPTAVSATIVVANACAGRKVRYSVPAYPSATATVAGGSGYGWSFTGNTLHTSLNVTYMIDSMDVNGLSVSRVIVVRYLNNAAPGTDSVRCSYMTNCGNTSAARVKCPLSAVTLQPSTSTQMATSCVSYEWNGNIYTTSGTKTWVGTNAVGCDSTVYLNLTIYQPSFSTQSISSCVSYNWNGTVYTTSGTKTWVGSNAVGCDSTAYLNLTITAPSASVETVFACNSYVWHGTTFTTSNNTATWTGVNADGCDSVVTLNLTVSTVVPAVPSTITQTLVSNICGQRVYRYEASAVTNALRYIWTLPVSVGGISGVTVDSGDVNSSRVIRLMYASNAASVTGDSIWVKSWSSCGTSNNKSAKLINALVTTPAVPASVTITLVSDICGARVYRYTAPALPVATTTALAATVYDWILPTGSAVATSATLDSGVLSGADARYIRLKYTNNGAAITGDSIRLRYSSLCGYSNTKAQKLSNLAITTLAAPSTLTGTTSICPIVGTTSSATYTCAAVTGAVSYMWTLPTGAVIDSGSNGVKIKVRFISAGANDSIYVQAVGTNSCSGAKKVLKLVTTGCVTLPTAKTDVNTVITAPNATMEVKLYPNPTTHAYQLFVKSSRRSQTINTRVVDLQGRVVKTLTFNSDETIAFGSELKAGVYLVEIREGKEIRTVKVIKY